MIKVIIDEQYVDALIREEIINHLKRFDKELVFWDSKELKRRTCLSWSTIQTTFFHEEGFPKVKLGGKWLFPAKEAEAFLLIWINGKSSEFKNS